MSSASNSISWPITLMAVLMIALTALAWLKLCRPCSGLSRGGLGVDD
jgi:hypothetical protein